MPDDPKPPEQTQEKGHSAANNTDLFDSHLPAPPLLRPNKKRQIQGLLDYEFNDINGGSQKSIIIKNNLDLFKKMKSYIN